MSKTEDSHASADGSATAIANLFPSPCLTRGAESWGDVHTAVGDRVSFYFQLCASPGALVARLDNIWSGGTFEVVPVQDVAAPVKVLLPPLQVGSYNLVWSFAVPPDTPWQSAAEVSVQGPGSPSDVVRFRLAKSSDGTHPVNHGFARIEVR